MAKAVGPDEQVKRALELQAQMSTWVAAAYLRNRNFTIKQTLWFLLGIKSERRLVTVRDTGFLTDWAVEFAGNRGRAITYWPDETACQLKKRSYS